MEKGNAKKFINGAVVGLALGIAGGIFLASKTGKKLRKNIKDTMADFYESIAPQLKKIEKMSEAEYKAFMKQAAEQYAKAKKLSGKIAQQLIKETQKSWKHFSQHLEE